MLADISFLWCPAHALSGAQIFASHAIGGIVGNLLTGLFAQKSVAGFDAITTIDGGWLDHHYIQLGYQLADSMSGLAYSFVMTVRPSSARSHRKTFC